MRGVWFIWRFFNGIYRERANTLFREELDLVLPFCSMVATVLAMVAAFVSAFAAVVSAFAATVALIAAFF